jgi:signal transduction histidine kinase
VEAQETPRVSEDYVLQVWEVEDGLPQNTISGIAQTPDGYLWLATWGGLARFDGVRFTTFRKDQTPGLDSNYIRTVHVGKGGELWVGLERGGVARMRAGKFEPIAPLAERTAVTSWVSSFAEDRGGGIWIGLAPELKALRWADGVLTPFENLTSLGSWSDTFVHADGAGDIWMATKSGCGILEGDAVVPVAAKAGPRVRLTPAKDGGMWAVRGDVLQRYRRGAEPETVAQITNLGGAAEVQALLEDRSGNVWLGTKGAGLYRFAQGQFTLVPTSHRSILSIAEDREGNLWVGTWGGGLNRLRTRRFAIRDARHGLPEKGIVSLCEDSSKALWLAVRDHLPVRSVDPAHRVFAPVLGLPKPLVTVVQPEPAGGVWIGTDGNGLVRWKNGVFERVGLDERVASLLLTKAGDLWVATLKGGLICWRDHQAAYEATTGGLVVVRALAEDRHGNVWAGTQDGALFRREGDRFLRVDLPESKPGESIRFIVPDPREDKVWIGALDGGLYRWKAGKVARLPHGVGLEDNDLRAMAIDPAGNFWIASGRGLSRAAGSTVDAVLDGEEATVRAITFGREVGLPNLGFIEGSRNAVAQTSDGHLWFATDGGALEIDPAEDDELSVEPAVLIEELKVAGKAHSFASGGRVTLPPHPGPIEIRYTAPALGSPERLRFRYRLAGLSEEWTDAGNSRVATFSRVPAGDFRFEVEASSTAGVWRAAQQTPAITVTPAWWETLLVRILTLLAGALAVAWLVRWAVLLRVRSRMRALEQQHAVERERTRIARDMHDELGASLTQITLTSEVAKLDSPDAAMSHVVEMGDIARRAVSALDEIVWAVNPRHDTLPSLLGYLGQHSVDFLQDAGIGCKVDLPDESAAAPLPAELRHQVFLVVREALHNIVKHSGATRVAITAKIRDQLLELTVSDDGCGFEAGALPPGADGLGNMRSRIAELGGECVIESQRGAGTTVRIQLPLLGAVATQRTAALK